ncbi:hypothetical protein [Archangium violaceum]
MRLPGGTPKQSKRRANLLLLWEKSPEDAARNRENYNAATEL